MDGIEKYIDDLGRVVIPMKLRDKLGMWCRAKVFVYLKKNGVFISLAEKYCVLCGGIDEIDNDLRLCRPCIKKL